MSQKLIVELQDKSCRPARPDEILRAEATKKRADELDRKIREYSIELDNINSLCRHKVCYDVDGITRQFRICVACGHTELF